jgi:hypothetical protein
MSYEVEAIPASASQKPNIPAAPMMKEERTFDPYVAKPSQVSTPEEKSPEESIRLSPQLAALARREQKFRQQQAQFESQRQSIAAEKEELAQLRAMKEKLAAKDYSALEGMVDYDEYSQYQLNRLNERDPVADEIKRLSGKLSEIEESNQNQLLDQFEIAVSERKIAAQELAEKSSNFPVLKKAKAYDLVAQHIVDTSEEDGVDLSVEQACKEVEMVIKQEAKKMASLLEDEIKPEEKKEPPKPNLKTITNQVTTSDARRPYKSYQGMSDTERFAEARRRAEEKLQLTAR